MPGIKALRKIQIGRENTPGTLVDATTVWRGEGTLEDLTEVVFVPEDIGVAGGSTRSHIAKVGAELSMETTPATYEQLPFVFDAGIMRATPVQDGAGSGWIRTYNIPETSKNTIIPCTIEAGDDQQEEEGGYFFVRSFVLGGTQGETWNIQPVWQGRQVSTGTYTAGVTIPGVEDMLFSKTLFYIDAIGAAYGTTQKSSTLLNAALNCTTGWIASPPGDGQLYFMFAKYTIYDLLLDITFEHDSTAVTEISSWRNQTERKIRLKTTGSALATAGTTYSVKTMIIDLPGKWESFEKIGERDGNDIVTGHFRSKYSVAAADAGQIVIVNEIINLDLNPSASASPSVSPTVSPSRSLSPSTSVSPSA